MVAMQPRRVLRHELRRRELHVAAVTQLAPPFVRVTLGGGDLAGFTAPGPADHVKVFFPGRLSATHARDYTPVAFRPDGVDGPELDLDFVLHGDSGPASSWAAKAKPGDRITIAGPRGSWLAPQDATRVVLVADETALPAARRWLDAFAAAGGIPITALFFVEDPATAAYLDDMALDGIDIRWLSGSDREAQVDAALRNIEADDLTFFALAGEAGALVPWRRHLRRERGLAKEQVAADGYWKRGEADRDHHAPLDPDDPDD
jgi:NADPH-dependent ferric siderophore reductase